MNPNEVNESLGLIEREPKSVAANEPAGDISSIDTNGNEKVIIQEAKDAGFSMPITSDFGYTDNDNSEMVGSDFLVFFTSNTQL